MSHKGHRLRTKYVIYYNKQYSESFYNISLSDDLSYGLKV
jgi:hypothetical protein